MRWKNVSDKSTAGGTIPDLSWLAKISTREWEVVKSRYAELLRLTFKITIKEITKMSIMQEDEDLQAALAAEITKELAEDESLPKSYREKLVRELQ